MGRHPVQHRLMRKIMIVVYKYSTLRTVPKDAHRITYDSMTHGKENMNR